jgi:hypothetical protein
MVADVLRVAIFTMLALLYGQAVFVLWFYTIVHQRLLAAGRDVAGLLPVHVFLVTVVLLAWATEIAFRSHDRIGVAEIGSWLVYNLVVFAIANVAVFAVLRFERRRHPHLPERPKERRVPE